MPTADLVVQMAIAMAGLLLRVATQDLLRRVAMPVLLPATARVDLRPPTAVVVAAAANRKDRALIVQRWKLATRPSSRASMHQRT